MVLKLGRKFAAKPGPRLSASQLFELQLLADLLQLLRRHVGRVDLCHDETIGDENLKIAVLSSLRKVLNAGCSPSLVVFS